MLSETDTQASSRVGLEAGQLKSNLSPLVQSLADGNDSDEEDCCAAKFGAHILPAFFQHMRLSLVRLLTALLPLAGRVMSSGECTQLWCLLPFHRVAEDSC